MKTSIFIFLLSLLLTLPCAGSIEVTQMDKTIITSLFRGEWEKSDSLVDIQLKNNPDNPKYYFLKAYVGFYSRYLGPSRMTRDQSIDLIHEYAWKAIEVGRKLPPSVETKFYLGCAYGLLCRANMMRQEYWLAYWNASESKTLLQQVLNEDNTVDDACMNLAIIEYFPAAAITGFRYSLAYMAGMGGSKEKGLQYFERTAEKGILFQDEATFALTIVYRAGESNIDKAAETWKKLHTKYPTNQNYENGYRQLSMISIVRTKGVQFLEDEFSLLKTKHAVTSPGILNSVGYSLMGEEKYTDALVVFQVNIKLFPHIANGYDSYAECYMNLKDNQNAIKYYRIAAEMLPKDTTVTETFRENLKNSIAARLKELGAQ
jgi:tetratricopeptide (TPR) repeat protein